MQVGGQFRDGPGPRPRQPGRLVTYRPHPPGSEGARGDAGPVRLRTPEGLRPGLLRSETATTLLADVPTTLDFKDAQKKSFFKAFHRKLKHVAKTGCLRSGVTLEASIPPTPTPPIGQFWLRQL